MAIRAQSHHASGSTAQQRRYSGNPSASANSVSFWRIETLPALLQPIARVMPLTYAADGLREVMIKGSGLDMPAVQLDLAVLAGIAALFVVLAAATIRREVA